MCRIALPPNDLASQATSAANCGETEEKIDGLTDSIKTYEERLSLIKIEINKVGIYLTTVPTTCIL